MAELFIELFSEEIPATLQVNARRKIKQILEEKLRKKEISFKSSQSFSTPNRLVVHIDKIKKQVSTKSEEIRGPNIKSPDKAMEGFLRSNNIEKSKIFIIVENEEELELLVSYLKEFNYVIIGAGSNILIRDKGFNGAIIKLGKSFNKIYMHEDCVEAGASILDKNLSIFVSFSCPLVRI